MTFVHDPFCRVIAQGGLTPDDVADMLARCS
jgi:hypothetical protein